MATARTTTTRALQAVTNEAAGNPFGDEEFEKLENGVPIPLGYDHGSFFYLDGVAQHVVKLTKHDKLTLLRIAPMEYWTAHDWGSNGVAWDLAADRMMQGCREAGPYDPANVRGRGCWWDRGRVVLHVGDQLIIGQEAVGLSRIKSKYVYERAPAYEFELQKPLTDVEAKRVLDVCRMLRWRKAMFAPLLAGWIVLAPVCGALGWRPHGWLTGPSNAGKSWTMDNVVRPLVPFHEFVQSETSSAGIRLFLNSDARPVLFDEAEGGESKTNGERLRSVLSLARQASSETGGRIVKGSSSGGAQMFLIRSAFLLAAVNPVLQTQMDRRRFVMLALRGPDPNADKQATERQFAELRRAVMTFDNQFRDRLFARTFHNLGTLRTNIETLASRIAVKIGNRGLGDQYGALLAGAYMLTSTGRISEQEADTMIAAMDWTEIVEGSLETDEGEALDTLAQSTLPIEGHVKQCLMAEAALWCHRNSAAPGYILEDVRRALMMRGVRVSAGLVQIANNSQAIKQIFSRTRWAESYKTKLSEAPGAFASDKTIRFGALGSVRALCIPINVFVNGDAGDEITPVRQEPLAFADEPAQGDTLEDEPSHWSDRFEPAAD